MIALAGCHSFKKENVQPPTPLAKDFKPTAASHAPVAHLVGDGAEESGVRLRPTVVDGVLYADSTDGKLEAIDANTGKTLWSKSSRTHGWFGWGDKKRVDAVYPVAPVCRVICLPWVRWTVTSMASTPRTAARAGMPSSIPRCWRRRVIVGDLVLVRTEDGNVFGLDAATGSVAGSTIRAPFRCSACAATARCWPPMACVFLGSDDGKLVALRQDNGASCGNRSLLPVKVAPKSNAWTMPTGRSCSMAACFTARPTTAICSRWTAPAVVRCGRTSSPAIVSLAISGNRLFGVDDESAGVGVRQERWRRHVEERRR